MAKTIRYEPDSRDTSRTIKNRKIRRNESNLLNQFKKGNENATALLEESELLYN